MRIGTAYAQQLAIEAIAERQGRLHESQAQIASGRRVNRPSDDPVAAAEAERIRSQQARVEAEQRAVGLARERLSSADNALGDATELLQQARESLLAAGTATQSPSDRAKHGQALREIRSQLLAVANRGDGTGGFVFGGQGAASAPFDASGTQYAALAGTRTIGQQMPSPVSLDGRENFTAVPGPTGPESIFTRLDAAIAVLEDPATTGAQANAATQVAIGGVDRSIERFATTRTVVGERLRALDAHEQALESGSIEAQSRLSALVDVDFARAVSELTQNQTTLQAAMQSYAQVSKMTLFDYL
jgi:flagellar hook-associated protein 3 FlgL